MIKYKYIKVKIIIFGGNLMKNFSSWLIAMFAFMFWGLRLVGTVMTSLGESFMFEPTDLTMEVVLLFITFICICFIFTLFLLTYNLILPVKSCCIMAVLRLRYFSSFVFKVSISLSMLERTLV